MAVRASEDDVNTILRHVRANPEEYIPPSEWKNMSEARRMAAGKVITAAVTAAVRSGAAQRDRLAAMSGRLQEENNALKAKLAKREALRKQLEELQRELARANASLQAANQRADYFENQARALADEVNALTHEKNRLAADLQRSIAEGRLTAQQLARLQVKYDEVMDRLDDAEARNRELTKRLDAVTLERDELRDQVSSLNQRNAQLEAENRHLRQMVEDLQRTLEAKLKIIEGQSAEIDRLNRDNAGLRGHNDLLILQLTETRDEKGKIERELEKIKGLYGGAIADLKTLDARHRELFERYQALLTKEREYQATISKQTLIIQQQDKQISSLTNALAVSQEETRQALLAKRAALDELQLAQAKIAQLEVKLNAETKKREEAEREAATLRSTVADLSKQLTIAKHEITRLESLLEKLKVEHQKEMKDAVERLKLSRVEIDDLKQKHTAELNAIHALLGSKHEETQKLQFNLNIAHDKLRAADIKIEGLEKELSSLKNQVAEKDKKIHQLETEVDKLKLENAELRKQLEAKEARIQAQAEQIRGLSANVSHLNTELIAAKGAQGKLEDERDALKSHLGKAKENIEELQTKYDKLETLYKSGQRDLKDQMEAAAKALEQSKKDNADLFAKFTAADIAAKQEKTRADLLENQLKALETQLRAQQEKILDLQKDLQVKDAKILEQQTNINQLKNENNALQIEAEAAKDAKNIADRALIHQQEMVASLQLQARALEIKFDREKIELQARYKDDVVELKKQLEVVGSRHANEKKTLEEQLQTAVIALTEKDKQLEALKKREHELNVKIVSMEGNIKDLTTELAAVIDARNKALDRIDALTAEVNKWTNKYNEEKAAREKAEQSRDEARAALVQKEAEAQAAKQDASKLASQLDDVNLKLAAKTGEFTAEKNQLLAEQQKLLDKQKEDAKLKDEADRKLLDAQRRLNEQDERAKEQGKDAKFWSELYLLNEESNEAFEKVKQLFNDDHRPTMLHSFESQKVRADAQLLLARARNEYSESLDVASDIVNSDPELAALTQEFSTVMLSATEELLEEGNIDNLQLQIAKDSEQMKANEKMARVKI